MSRAVRVLLKELLVYAQKKGGSDFATALGTFFSDMRTCTSDDEITEVTNQYFATIKEMNFVPIQKDQKYHLTVSDKTFRIYCDRNKQEKLFLVIDYWSHGEHHYCYQLLSNNIAIALSG